MMLWTVTWMMKERGPRLNLPDDALASLRLFFFFLNSLQNGF